MPQLPFQVAPKRRTQMVTATIGEDTYSLEFPVYNSLRSGEEIAIRDSDYQAAVYREASRLADALVEDGTAAQVVADRIGKDGDATTDPAAAEEEANRLAIRCLSNRLGIPVSLGAVEQRILMRHAPLVAQIQSTLTIEYAEQVRRTVTALIAHRLPGCRDWTEADTDEQVPGPLRDAIAAFADQERNANQPKRSADELIDSMVETLGKLGPDSPQSPPTGEPSTGDAESSGPPLLSSAQSDSDDSPPPTSSKRSRKAPAEN